MYICECGRNFEKANSLNGHYSHCLIHRNGKIAIDRFKDKRAWCKGKTYEERLGEVKAKEYKATLSLSKINWHKENEISVETRNILSKKRIFYLENNKGLEWFIVNNGNKEIKVQGKWEKAVAEWLNDKHIKWDRTTLHFDKSHRYTPDFYLPEYDWYIEVKGWLRDTDCIKMNKVILEHDIIIKMISKEEYFKLKDLTIFDLPEWRNWKPR